MDEVERLDGVAPVDDGRDVDLGSTLGDHLDVDVAFSESAVKNEEGELADRDEGKKAETHVNILPAIPTMFFICFPTSERMHMSRLMET